MHDPISRAFAYLAYRNTVKILERIDRMGQDLNDALTGLEQGVLALSAAEAQDYAKLTELAHNRGGVGQLSDEQAARFTALSQKLAVELGAANAALADAQAADAPADPVLEPVAPTGGDVAGGGAEEGTEPPVGGETEPTPGQ